MDYNKIKTEMKKRRFPLTKIAKIAGLTPQGLRGALAHGTLRIDHLEKISKEIDVHMIYWFEETGITTSSMKSEKEINRLNKQIDDLNDDKQRLKKQIDELREKLGLNKEAV